MIIQGIDTATLGNQFSGVKQGRVLISDGDGPAYVVAATVKTLPTAIRRYQQSVLEHMFLAQAETARVHLTHERSAKNGRFKIIAQKPYQGQRKGSAKPPLLGAVRAAVAQPSNWLSEYDVTMHHILEADDGMIIDAYRLKEHGIIRSDDKDLRMTPYPYYDIKTGKIFDTDPFGRLYLDTSGSQTKLYGHSLKFFWAQMLMGDTADNIKGILKLDGKLCGPAAAFAALDPLDNIEKVCNFVIGAYREIGQNPLPEGWLLWLLRYEGDSFWQYLSELPFLDINRRYLDECVRLPWFNNEVPAGNNSSDDDGSESCE